MTDVVPVDARGDRLLKQLGPIIDRWNAVLARAGSDYRVAVHALKQPDRRTPNTARFAPCGTTSAYLRHLRRGEEPDEACRDANRTRGREQAAKRRARRAAA